ncbi:MAG: di-heme oxidoredictase family protein [Pseudomonadota bacterium]
MLRLAALIGLAGAALAASCYSGDSSEQPLAPSGASWTARPSVRPTLIVPASVLDSAQKLDFWTGMGFFRDPWVPAPASTTARDGLGPLFNAQSCIACHAGAGRGASVLAAPESLSTIVKLGVRQDDGSMAPHPRYGAQLQTQAIYPRDAQRVRTRGAYFPGEASAVVRSEQKTVEFADGSSLSLTRPRVALPEGDASTVVSMRIAPSLIGLGLLERVPEAALVVLEDEHDADGDGVSGRINWLGDGADRRVGRFGWKARHPSVAEQTATAFAEDLGISNPLQKRQNCSAHQLECARQPTGNDATEGVEITQALFDRVVFFAEHIAPPPPAELTERIDDGRRLFTKSGCAACHTPSHVVDVAAAGGEHREERIWPYTDLLLHDMGPDLADQLIEGGADGREWRTAPLWGIGRTLAINEHTGLLHDGRARSVAEAIAWHGGEAKAARDRFLKLGLDDREALAAFVKAL